MVAWNHAYARGTVPLVVLTILLFPLARGALGANYNEHLIWVRHNELRRAGAQWIRGFVEMHSVNVDDPPRDPNIKAILDAADAGFSTILSMKWNYKNTDFPGAGSPELAEELLRVDTIIRAIWGKVDIVVIGNEPFVEAQEDQRGRRLSDFYQTMAEAVIGFRNAQGVDANLTRLYMGALNRMDLPDRHTPPVERMLRFIASRPELDGVDLHLHIPHMAGHKAMLEYCLARIRPEQTFLATEFSMIWHWKAHMRDEVSEYYRTAYRLAPGTQVYQVIDGAIRDPIPATQWEDFLANESWYAEHRGFIRSAIALYRATGRLDVATYSACPMRKRRHAFLPTDTPWMLNGIIAPSTVQPGPDGTAAENFPWGEEFRLIQAVP
ncbi:hypothetical protein GMORB2_7169 [Geosmithia morbida]|uniref:Asl1-like glycosyl hydrolase catalytic domain-containing protein n=1 Tax=Geosmithia morbida TaxID=1094350 RepID=A0A9P4YUN9_9HYPO|nr:uncharacterized protein GMORB2_7169 [Geosmithia morbida]KAF4122862.1 hypothetical protein GMORB2_7169 [Geosmithia morbida]